MVTLPEVLRNYPENNKGLAFNKCLYNFLIRLVTHCKNITIIQLTLLPIYLNDLEILSSVEHLKKNLKYLSFSCKIEDF